MIEIDKISGPTNDELQAMIDKLPGLAEIEALLDALPTLDAKALDDFLSEQGGCSDVG